MSGQYSAGTRTFFQRDMEALETVLPNLAVSNVASREPPLTARQASSRAVNGSASIVAVYDTGKLPKEKLQIPHKDESAYAQGMGFSTRLKDARTAKGLTGETVGGKLGVTKATVSKWETGKHEPNVDQIRALCRLYGVSPDWLFEWAKDELPADAMTEARIYSKLPPEEQRKWKALRRAMFSVTVD